MALAQGKRNHWNNLGKPEKIPYVFGYFATDKGSFADHCGKVGFLSKLVFAFEKTKKN